MRTLACVAIAYLVGSVPLGLVVVHALRPGIDLRALGSGNVGASNIFRNAGIAPAVVAGPLQFAQGLVPVLIGRWAELGPRSLALVAVAAMVGNGWSVWLRFDGGRGIAVATGAVAGLGLPGFALLLLCYLAGQLVDEIAIGVLVGFILLPAVELAAGGASEAAGALTLLLLVLLRRLEGAGDDLAHTADPRQVLVDRLVRDRRPGRPLVGRRTDR